METKTMAVIGVVALLLAGGAAFIFLSDGEEEQLQESMGLGAVFGNANGDFRIDSLDVELIEQLSKEKDTDTIRDNLEKYPYADANRDGKIDGKDADAVRDIINGKTDKVVVIDDSGSPKTICYPYTDLLVTGGTNMRVAINVLQMEEHMLANYTNRYAGDILDRKLCELRESGDIVKVSSKATSDDIAILSKLDLKGAVIEKEGMGAYGEPSAMEYFESKGIEPLNFTMDDAERSMMAISVLGIIMGAEDRAEAYVTYLQGVLDTVDKTLGDDNGTSTVMTVVMSNSVSGTSSDYFAMSEVAGGKNIADWPESTRKFDPKSGDIWLLDPKYNPDYLLHIKSIVYGQDVSDKDVNKYKGYFEDTKAYENGNYYLINGTLPLPVRIAYMSEIMYPDSYEQGWADGVFQEYMDDFGQVKDWDVTEHRAVWSVSDF